MTIRSACLIGFSLVVTLSACRPDVQESYNRKSSALNPAFEMLATSVQLINDSDDDRLMNNAPHLFYLEQEFRRGEAQGSVRLRVENFLPSTDDEGCSLNVKTAELQLDANQGAGLEADMHLCLSQGIVVFSQHTDSDQAIFKDSYSGEVITVEKAKDPERTLSLKLQQDNRNQPPLAISGLCLNPAPGIDWTGDWGYCNPEAHGQIDDPSLSCIEDSKQDPWVHPEFQERVNTWIEALTAGFFIELRAPDSEATASVCQNL